MILLLKTAHSLVTGPGEIKMVMNWRHPLYWLAFLIPEVPASATEGEVINNLI